MLRHLLIIPFLAVWLMAASGCGPVDRDLFTAAKSLTLTPMDYDLKYEEMVFVTCDGKQLKGWLVAGDPAKPALLYFHGNGSNLSGNMDYLRLFNRLGSTVFIFDYRGYGESTGEVMSEDDLYEDARAAVRYLENQGIHHEQLVYYGQSLGAAMAVQMALESPPAGMVLESSFTSFPDMALRMAPIMYRLFGWCCKIDKFDNLSKIDSVKVPLLFIHGDKDLLVPLEMSRRLFERAHEPKIFHVIKGGGHCEAAEHGGEEYLKAWRVFISSVSVVGKARTASQETSGSGSDCHQGVLINFMAAEFMQ
jgi:pimeloyl-ACP methyl ester carboxylesterase